MGSLNITAVAVAGMGVIGTFVTWIFNRRPQQADYASKLLDSTVPAYQALAERLSEIEARNKECEIRNDKLEAKCDRMIDYLRSVGLEPPVDET